MVTQRTARDEQEPAERGLSIDEAQQRLRDVGPNQLVPETRRAPWLAWLIRPFADPMVLLLLGAGVVYLYLRDTLDAATVLVALVPIALVSVVLEARAEQALDRLRHLTAPTATVWRDGRRQVVPVEQLVPGDLVSLREGDVIPADGVLALGSELTLDESALTGESAPVVKTAQSERDERDLCAGTSVRSGRGWMRVTETGPRTRFGQVGTLVASIEQTETPLQRLIARLVGQLAIGAALVCAAVAGIELIAGHGIVAAITAAVSLAIAAVPEEFPMVYTLYLSLGAWRLAREHALVRRLPSVETLGATTTICTDKTGTLTLGTMEVAALWVGDGEPAGREATASDLLAPATRALVRAAVLASEPCPFDPLERAIVRFAEAQGLDAASLQNGTLLQDYPFDPLLKYVSHVWGEDGQVGIFAKGSTEGILEGSRLTDEARGQVERATDSLARRGLRVIAVSAGVLEQSQGARAEDESHLRFVGLLGFVDPLRPGVTDALDECRDAGIRVVMVTGDHPVTALAVADGLGLPYARDQAVATGAELDRADPQQFRRLVREVNVFARVRPEQKYRLVRALKELGQVVAMTGDGINDAPALREADIGVAMGQRGTEVAREAADLILLDDDFTTIVAAVRDGRRIFENLRRAFAYLIAFHTPLLLAALVVPFVGAPLLLLPVHLIWSELFVHPTSSLVFENDPPPPDLMSRPPRPPGLGLLVVSDFIRALAQGLALFAGVVLLFLIRLGQGAPEADARALAITALFLGQVLLVLAARSPLVPLWRMGWGHNRALPLIIGATLLSLIFGLYLPGLAELLRLAPLTPAEWLLAILIAGATTLWLEPFKSWQRRGLAPNA